MTKRSAYSAISFRILSLILCLGMTGCDTGTPAYWGAEPVRVTAQGMEFDVRVRGLKAEAVRRNVMWMPKDHAVAQAASQAISQVTGCAVADLTGDPSVVQARLKCAGRPAPVQPARPPIECEGEILARPAIDMEEVILTCQ